MTRFLLLLALLTTCASAVTVTLSEGLVEVETNKWSVSIYVRQFDNTTKTWQRLPNFLWSYKMDRVLEYWNYDHDIADCRNMSCIPLPHNYSLTDPGVESTAQERQYNVSMPGGATAIHHERKVTLPNGAKFISTFSTYDRATYKDVAGWKLHLSDQGVKIVTRIEDWPPTVPYPTNPNLSVSERKLLAQGTTITQLLPAKDASLTAGYDKFPFFVYSDRPLPDPVALPAPLDPIYNFDLAFRHRFFNLTMGFLSNSTRCSSSTDESTCVWTKLNHAGLAEGNNAQLLQFLFGQIPLNFDVDVMQTFRTDLIIGMWIGNDSTVEWDPNLDILFADNYQSSISSPLAAGAPGGGTVILQGDNSVTGLAVGISLGLAAVVVLVAIGVFFVLQRRKRALASDRLNRIRESSMASEAASKPSRETATPAKNPEKQRQSTWEKPTTPSDVRNTIDES